MPSPISLDRPLSTIHAPISLDRPLSTIHAPISLGRPLSTIHAPISFDRPLCAIHAPISLGRPLSTMHAPISLDISAMRYPAPMSSPSLDHPPAAVHCALNPHLSSKHNKVAIVQFSFLILLLSLLHGIFMTHPSLRMATKKKMRSDASHLHLDCAPFPSFCPSIQIYWPVIFFRLPVAGPAISD
eukprot:363999-Chlamydomonas_euryale.AAC.6